MLCHNLFSASKVRTSKRTRLHRVIESGLVVAARVQKTCVLLRFATKTELQASCGILGESLTAGQRCRLPKISAPKKSLWIYDLINVVRGSDICEPAFSSRMTCDGIDLEFDGICELFITIRYTRYAYTKSSHDITGGCDPLLSSLICCLNPYKQQFNKDGILEEVDGTSNEEVDDDATKTCVHESDEFEDNNGCVYRASSMNSIHVSAKSYYPRRDNSMYGCKKVFDLARTKMLIQRRLN